MTIKARGNIRSVEDDLLLVDWDPNFSQREWYFFTHRHAVWRLNSDNRWSSHLKRFIFENENQDLDAFLNSELWRRYRDEDEKIRQAKTGPPAASYRKASPSADKVYDAFEEWKTALIEGRSLFSGQPLDYREASQGLIDFFVNRPDVGDGSFLEKLRSQLEFRSEEHTSELQS